MKDNRAVLFDLDGTLLDTLEDIADSTNYILAKYGYIERSVDEIRRFLGNGAAYLISSALPVKLDDESFNAVLEEYKEYYKAHSNIKTRPYDGVIDLLKKLKQSGICTAVVSNKPDAATKKLCEQYFESLIDFSIGDRADICRKPSADPIKKALEVLACNKAVYVGDSEVDFQTAKNAQLPCISLTWGFRDREFLEESGARCFANNADEIEKLIFEFLGEDYDVTE